MPAEGLAKDVDVPDDRIGIRHERIHPLLAVLVVLPIALFGLR
jgi:hypothetical protein